VVDVFDIICCCLKVAGSIVALGDEDVVLGTILKGLRNGDGRSLLKDVSVFQNLDSALQRRKKHENRQLTINCSSTAPRRSRPGWSSRWWFAVVSAMVETMAIQYPLGQTLWAEETQAT
jgi:hypothetical protein